MSEFKAFSEMTHTSYCGRFTQLNEFLLMRQLPMLQAGDERRAQLDSVEKVQAYAKEMRETFIEKLGGVPERECPLNPQITSVRDMGNYTQEAVIFNSRKGVYVTGTMYIPKGLTEPSAAVLLMSGHSENGRMYKVYQAAAQTIAEAGIIVFSIDPPGQGERRSFIDRETGEIIVNSPIFDHDCCGISSMLTGRFIESFFLSDQFAAVDYMLTRKEIDPNRIGVTGCSGGGTQSVTMMLCDERIAAAAPCCFTSNRREIMFTNQSQDAEQIWPGCAEYGLDHHEAFVHFAPKPALMLIASADIFPPEGAYDVLEQAKKIYSLFGEGKEDNVRIFELEYYHGYAPEFANAAAAFFCEVFGIERKGPQITNPLEEKDMIATKSGNVLGDFEDALTIIDESMISAAELKKNRKLDEAKQWLMEKVMHGRLPSKPWLKHALQRYVNGYTGKICVWWVQDHLAAYGVLISKGENPHVLKLPTVIAVWNNGTMAIAEHEAWIKAQCEAGKQVLVVDLPGVGNIEQPRIWRNYTYYEAYGTMYKMCCDLLYMGDSMAAMQTYHLLRTVDMLKESLGLEDISFYCDDGDGVFGILAGYLADLKREYGENILTNAEKEILSQKPLKYENTLSHVIPDMLQYFDFDEIM